MRQRNLAVNVLGDLSLAPPSVQQAAAEVQTTSRTLPRVCGVLNVMFAYTSTHELARALQGHGIAQDSHAACSHHAMCDSRSKARRACLSAECVSERADHRACQVCERCAASQQRWLNNGATLAEGCAHGGDRCTARIVGKVHDSARQDSQGRAYGDEHMPFCCECGEVNGKAHRACRTLGSCGPFSGVEARRGARMRGGSCRQGGAGPWVAGKNSSCAPCPAIQNGCTPTRIGEELAAQPLAQHGAAAVRQQSALLCANLRSEMPCGARATPDSLWAEVDDTLLTSGSPPVDLLLRTSGESRLSDFLVWQCRRAHLCWVNDLWPALGVMRFVGSVLAWQRATPHLCAIARQLDGGPAVLRPGVGSQVVQS